MLETSVAWPQALAETWISTGGRSGGGGGQVAHAARQPWRGSMTLQTGKQSTGVLLQGGSAASGWEG